MLPSRLGQFCHQVLVAGLMAVVIVVPLFFNPHSQLSFEPDKIAVFRSIVLLMVAAWGVRTLEERASRRPGAQDRGVEASGGTGNRLKPRLHQLNRLKPRLRQVHVSGLARMPLVWLACGLLGAYVVATVASISPRTSLWGSYERSQGLYTVFSYVALFLLALHVLRTERQVEHIVTIILLVSFPVSLYGIMQHYRLDPFIWSKLSDPLTERAASTLGGPIFAAGYLAMVIPLTLIRLVKGVATIVRRTDTSSAPISIVIYSFLLALQLASFLFTQSRGPLVGLLAGLILGSLLVAILKGQWPLILSAILISVEILLFFAILNLPNTPLQSLKETPFGRLGRIFELRSGTGEQRTLMWQGVVNLLRVDPRRALIGYGPGTIQFALDPHWPDELARKYGRWGVSVDRAHNDTFDAVVTTGLIGTAVYLLLFGALFHYGCQGLGLIKTSRQQGAFALLSLAGALMFSWIARVVDGSWRLSGLAIPAGMIGGLLSYLLLYSVFVRLRAGGQRREHTVLEGRQLLFIGLLSALTAHFIEIQFGIPTATSRAYFWIYLALLIVLGGHAARQSETPIAVVITPPSLPKRRRRRRSRGTSATSEGSTRTITLQQASFIAPSLMTGLVLSTLGFDFLVSGPNLAGPRINVLWLLAATWILSGILEYGATDDNEALAPTSPSEPPVMLHQALSVTWFLLFTVGYALARRPGIDPSWTFVLYLAWVLLTLLLAAAVQLRPGEAVTVAWRRGGWLYVPMAAIAAALIVLINVNFVRADIYCREGLKANVADTSIAFLQRALHLRRDAEYYYTALADAYIVKAKTTTDPSQMARWFEQGGDTLLQGWQSNPYNAEHMANLGRLHLQWATLMAEPEARAAKLVEAMEYYRQATAMSPRLDVLLAEEISQIHFLLGQAYDAMGEKDQARTAYEAAQEIEDASVWTYLARGKLRAQEGNAEAALQALDAAQDERMRDRDPDRYVFHWGLMEIYKQLGQVEKAISEAETTRQLAPRILQPMLEESIRELQE